MCPPLVKIEEIDGNSELSKFPNQSSIRYCQPQTADDTFLTTITSLSAESNWSIVEVT